MRKFKEIIEIAFPEKDAILEAKLELLHNCLVFETIPETLDSLLSSYNEVFSIFKKEKKETMSPFDKEYIKALTTFRNALLDS